MKKILRIASLFSGITVCIIGCERFQPPEAPSPISPYEILEGDSLSIKFVWKSVDDAKNYVLQIATDEEFEHTVFIDSTITDTSHTVAADTFSQTGFYYWRVAAGNENGWSEWSQVARFFIGMEDWLIAPEDSVIFATQAPLLIWHSYPEATGYVIRVCRGSFNTTSTVWEDTTSDTTCQLPEAVLLENRPGTYWWAVLMLGTYENLFWTKPGYFFSRMMLDLDTTYFPLGFGYEWCSEGRNWGNQDAEEWDYNYTSVLRVTDSFWVDDVLCFIVQGGYAPWGSGFMFIQDTVRIWGDRIALKWWDPFGAYFHDTISVVHPDTTSYWDHLNFKGDTLIISWWDEKMISSLFPYEGFDMSTYRLNRIGPIYRDWHYDWSTGGYHDNIVEHLLYFYNGKDTVWKAEE